MAIPQQRVEGNGVVGAPGSSSPFVHNSGNDKTPATIRRQRPLKQKMALSFKSLVSSAQKLVLGDNISTQDGNGSNHTTPADPANLFPATNTAVDGDDCDHDCESCHIKYPRDFKIDEADELYGHVKGWSTHVLVATSKSDWVRDVADEKGSVMEALDRETSAANRLQNGRMMLSASNMPTPHGTTDYSEPTTVLLLPAFALVHNVSPANVPSLVDDFISRGPTSTTPLATPMRPSIPRSVPSASTQNPEVNILTATPSPHNVVILLCSQKTRDARCGQSAPLLKRELERHLRPLGLYRDADDQRPGGVGIYFISHVGGHKYSANMMVYRRPDAFGVDDVDRAGAAAAGAAFKIDPLARFKAQKKPAVASNGNEDDKVEQQHNETANGHATQATSTTTPPASTSPPGEETPKQTGGQGGDHDDDLVIADEGASQCIWLARIKPEDCENIVRYTVLQGRVVKPGTQLRGGFDRGRSVVSW
ncbi:Sucrase/ferredoxin-like [Microdochium nivale]|nr:Sucrase/ferredoxin-like [Microdochium nivale]